MLEIIAFVIGEELAHNLSVCLKKDDAVEIANADRDRGRDAAQAIWMAKEECGTVPVVGHRVGKVVHQVTSKSGNLKVIEIRHRATGEVMGYFLTTDAIEGAKGVRHILA